MKFIGKYKDYYDYVVGHDSDPRKVYVRKLEYLKCPIDISYAKMGSYFLGEVWFCDKLYPYLRHIPSNSFWYDYFQIPEQVKEAVKQERADAYSDNYYRTMDLEGHFDIERDERNKGRRWWYSTHFRKIKVALNSKYQAPVLFTCCRSDDFPDCLSVKNGLLSEVKFGQVMTPQEAYTELYNWIPYYEPKMPDDPTDMGRFENKGFSKKTSFRGK